MLRQIVRFSGQVYKKTLPVAVRKKIHGTFFFRLLMRFERSALTHQPIADRLRGAKLMSMIVPCYNVSLYIDRFFESLIEQVGTLNDVEVLCVDDGSTDSTPEKLKHWAEKYPGLIRVITQPNGGPSAARNTGLREAAGDWVSFPDPDDFLEEHYVSIVRLALNRGYDNPLLAVCCKLVFYHEDVDEFSNSHPLTSRFSEPVSNVSTDNMMKFIHLAANTCWLPRVTLLRHDLAFDGHGWGSFEDAHMINRLFMLEPHHTVSFVESAHYYYRKRKDSSSMVDTAKKKKTYWLDQMEDGCLDLLKFGARLYGTAPNYVQRTVLYEIMWRVHHLIKYPFALDEVLTDAEILKSKLIFEQIMDELDESTIRDFNLARTCQEHKVGLLGCYKLSRVERHALYIKDIDLPAGVVKFAYYAGGNDDLEPTVYINGSPIDHTYVGERQVRLYGDILYREVLIKISMQHGDRLECHFDGIKAMIKQSSRALGESVSWIQLVKSYFPAVPASNKILSEPDTSRIRDLITSPNAQRDYRGCWILMDADVRADDNAEHLYRYLMNIGAADNVYFVLDKSSNDWPRLEADGFKLLAMRSDEHLKAQFNAALVVSSHADHYVTWPMGRPLYKDLANFKSVFLQHGVIKDDLSRWLNSKQFDAFITSTTDEYNSIVSPESRYAYYPDNVFLTGLPRHDSLLKQADKEAVDSIIIMPTWRRELTDESDRTGNERKPIDSFAHSEFAQNWKAVLHSDGLRKAAKENGLNIVFVPHPNMAMYIDEFDIPDWVDALDVCGDMNYQSVLSKCALMITDYSSIAFEAAYIERPVVYFQFDVMAFFDGNHVYDKGYFSYENDGFGPVVETVDELLESTCNILRDGPDKKYVERQVQTFKYRDYKCSERVHQVLKRLTSY